MMLDAAGAAEGLVTAFAAGAFLGPCPAIVISGAALVAELQSMTGDIQEACSSRFCLQLHLRKCTCRME